MPRLVHLKRPAGDRQLTLARGAAFREVVLIGDKYRAVERFCGRGADDADPWHRQVRQIVAEQGGTVLLADIYDRLSRNCCG